MKAEVELEWKGMSLIRDVSLVLIDSPATSEDLGNMTLSIPVPKGTDAGEYILTAAIPYLVGVSTILPLLSMAGDADRSGLWVYRDKILQSYLDCHRLVIFPLLEIRSVYIEECI